jgi:hypothetical protein
VHTRFWWGHLKERDHLEDPGADVRIIMGVVDWIDLALIIRQVAATCECGNELTGSVKCGEFPDWLRTC